MGPIFSYKHTSVKGIQIAEQYFKVHILTMQRSTYMQFYVILHNNTTENHVTHSSVLFCRFYFTNLSRMLVPNPIKIQGVFFQLLAASKFPTHPPPKRACPRLHVPCLFAGKNLNINNKFVWSEQYPGCYQPRSFKHDQ